MKVLDIKATKGPNYWSVWRQKLIVLKLDIEELEEQPTDRIPGFLERLKEIMPSLYNHQCSEERPGGFFERVKSGTWMGHVVEHIAIELQKMADLDVSFGKTRETTTKGVYNVVFAYETEKAGKYAAEAAVRIAEALIAGKKANPEADAAKIKHLYYYEYPGPSTISIVKAAQDRGIPVLEEWAGIIQFGYGAKMKRIKATITSQTGSIAVDIAGDKEDTKNLLSEFGIPVPTGTIVKDRHELMSAVEKHGYPLVIKPLNGNQGKGATINATDWTCTLKGFLGARKYSKEIIVEKYITGHDYRLLVINKKFVAASLRTPAMVIGDGKSTVKQLVDEVNKDPRRGPGHDNVLTYIKIDDMSRRILESKGYNASTILKAGEKLLLKDTANLSTGGTAKDVTDEVHPDNVFMAEQIAALLDLDICGVDVMTNDISQPLKGTGGAVLEVNAAPGFRMHTHPAEGKARDVGRPVIDMLFPMGSEYTIPIVAITGTNGKTTTTRLIAHMARVAGKNVGYTNTDGIYLNEHTIERGDCSGPSSARLVLRNPSVDFAVLECARGGILRSGLGFEFCNTAVVTNIASDHMGLGGIDTLEDLAKVKSVVPESVVRDGYAILNADDDHVYDMANYVSCRVALYSMDSKNPRVIEHLGTGGLAAVLEGNDIVIRTLDEEIRIEDINEIPLTMKGRATFNIENILGAVLAGYVNKLSIPDIREALRTFVPSPELTPGRMNVFDFGQFELMVDYAHNPAGLRALGKFLSHITAHKVGVITGVGDRRDEDIIEAAMVAGELFDEIVLRLDKDLRGRSPEELLNLLHEGLRKSGAENKVSHTSYSEPEACEYVIRNAKPDSFITFCADKVDKVIEVVKHLLKEAKAVPVHVG